MKSGLQIVWFKRDLRLEDHRPLCEAVRRGAPLLALYVYEPEIVGAEDFDASHLVFINQSLAALDGRLRAVGGRLTCRVGRLPDVFDHLHAEHGIARLWSHEESGNALTYARDRRVGAWCRDRGIPWTEVPQHGVFRPHPGRDGWAQRWTARMSETITPRQGNSASCPPWSPGISRLPPISVWPGARRPSRSRAASRTDSVCSRLFWSGGAWIIVGRCPPRNPPGRRAAG